MEIQGNSIIDTVIEYANVKFGVEMTAEQASKQLQNMTSSDTLRLDNAVKNEDDASFSELIDPERTK